MFSQLFGEYLVERNILTREVVNVIIEKQMSARVKLGTIAVAAGVITEKQADEINHLQTQQDKRFGDIALENDYMTEVQLHEILSQQANPFMKFLQILTEETTLSVTKIDGYLTDFQQINGFSDTEMRALKNEDIDGIVPVFAYAGKPYVTDLTALVLRNLIRFISSNFYIGKIRPVVNYNYKWLAGQKICGNHEIYLAFGSSDEADGLLKLAGGYAGREFTEMENLTYDSINEFTNVCSGLLATEFSAKKVIVDMEVPFVYTNQNVSGRGYVIPLYLQGSKLEIFISVDEDIVMGNAPEDTTVAKRAGSEITSDSKGTVVIVDDSALVRANLRDLIEGEGYTVVSEAVNGEDAVEMYKKYSPDLITLDITMPIKNGVDALKEIIAADPAAKVVMVTAAGQQRIVIDAIKLGAERFIMKPFSEKEVISMLDDIIPAKAK